MSMENKEILITEEKNCRVENRVLGEICVLQLQVTDKTVPAVSILNQDTETDAASVIAGCRLTIEPDAGEGLMAVYQHKSWWIRPEFPSLVSEIPERTQLLLWKEQGRFGVLLAVCDQCLRTDLRGSGQSILLEVSANGCAADAQEHICAAYGYGEDPYACIEALAAAVCEAQGRTHILRSHKKFPEIFQKFGWCTWDAFYHKVNEADILRKLEEFREKEIPVGWMLIDDGWSDADYETRKLKALTADPVKFPQGIGHTADIARSKFGIAHVGVWHAMMGYWTGMKPDSEVYRQFEPELILKNEHDYVLKPDKTSIAHFYDTWHTRLAEQEHIDFIKVDGQGSSSIYYKGQSSYGESSGSYHQALEESAERHFQGNLINCMGMAPQNMWLREHSAVSRSSDDFVPEVPHGFREHALQNSYNSLLQGQFYWGDWDMFWSEHEENRQNSVLRAVSGGPVYISDQPGKTDAAYILPLLDQQGNVLRCEQTGVPTRDCLLTDPLHSAGLLKIYNSSQDACVVAAFNIAEEEKQHTGWLSVGDIPQLQGASWLAYHHFAGKCETLSDEQPVALTLPANGAELLLLLKKKAYGQFIGAAEKYISSYCILEESADEHHLRGHISEGGRILFVCDRKPVSVLVNGREVPFQDHGSCYEVSAEDAAEIEIHY